VHVRARQKESEYEESIAAYKETSTFRLVTKWNKKCRVRQKKKALREANRSLRLHYYVRLLTSDIRTFIATWYPPLHCASTRKLHQPMHMRHQ
jgi:hypothetical protein